MAQQPESDRDYWNLSHRGISPSAFPLTRPEWVEVSAEETGIRTLVLQVPGGWLVRVDDAGAAGQPVFVPDCDYVWKMAFNGWGSR